MNYEAIIAEKEEKIHSVERLNTQMSKEIFELKFQVEKLQRMLFGKKGEGFKTAPYTGPNLFSDLPGEEHQAVAPIEECTTHVPAHERKKSKQKGRSIFDNLPTGLAVEETIIEPNDKPEGAVLMGAEVQRKLGYKPGKFYVKQISRNKYVDKLTGKIHIAPKPNEAIERCEADTSLIVDVVVSKFVDHMPEYRKLQQYKRDGVIIPPSTMNDWTHRIAEYITLVAQAIKSEILNTGYIQIDESTIKVLQKDKSKVGYMWVINSPELRMSYFDFHPSRGAKVPKLLLDNYTGALQSDGYNAYEVLEKVSPEMNFFNCWSHARRKFVEAQKYNKELCSEVLSKIQILYKIEQRCRDEGLNHDQRKSLRQQESLPVLIKLKEYLEEQAPKQIDRTPVHTAIGYTLSRWSKLTAYVDHGEVEIDNNLVENAIRPLALGRKNYLFAGTPKAAANIAIYYTIFSSCKSLNINPVNYLTWLLTELPNASILEVANFTPTAYEKLLANQ